MRNMLNFFNDKIKKYMEEGEQIVPSHCFLGYNLFYEVRRQVYREQKSKMEAPPSGAGQTSFTYITSHGRVLVKQVEAETSNFVMFGRADAFDIYTANKVILGEI